MSQRPRCSELFGGRGSHQVRKGRDHGCARQPIIEKLPERHSQLAARLLQPQERVPASLAKIATRAAAHLPQPRVLADVALRQVVMQRQVGVLQHRQKFIAFGTQQPQRVVQCRVARALPDEVIEFRLQDGPLRCVRTVAIFAEPLVECPDPVPHLLYRPLMLRRQRDQPGHFPLDAVFVTLLKQPRLGNLAVVDLIKHELLEPDSETPVDIGWQLGGSQLPALAGGRPFGGIACCVH